MNIDDRQDGPDGPSIPAEGAAPAPGARGPALDEEALAGLVPVTRRELLGLMGAGLGLAGLEGCTRQPVEKIVPYVRAPEELVPGRPLYYASTLVLGGYGTGVLVESHMGRPTKIEGNPDHPASHGGTDAFAQASIRTLYDPDRSQTVIYRGQRDRSPQITSFASLVDGLTPALAAQTALGGAGLRILSGTVCSPTLGAQLRALLAALPEARWYTFEPAGRENAREGAIAAFGRPVETHYRFDRADCVLSIDSDFLGTHPVAARYARDFSNRRRIRQGDGGKSIARGMNRLYVLEPTPSLTGAKADHRLALRSGSISTFVQALASQLGVSEPPRRDVPAGLEARWIASLAKDLGAHKGSSLVIAGDAQPPFVHALAHALNYALGNVGKTVFNTEPIEQPGAKRSLAELTEELDGGKVEIMLFLGGTNPVYSAPGDLDFKSALGKAQKALTIHHGLYQDETAQYCNWHVPESHELESWSDARAFDGTIGIVQPLIAPLYASKTAHELVSALAGNPRKTSYDLVRDYWKTVHTQEPAQVEASWERALHDGVVKDSAYPPLELPKPLVVVPSLESVTAPDEQLPGKGRGRGGLRKKTAPASKATFEAIFRPDPTIGDGRFSNNEWLQELPKPLTKLTWGNAIWIAPATAKKLGLKDSDLLEIATEESSIEAPALIVPGHAEAAVTLFLGYGRKRAGRSGTGLGYDAYAFRASAALYVMPNVTLKAKGRTGALFPTHGHHQMEGRNPVRAATFDAFKKQPDFAQKEDPTPPKSLSLYPERLGEGQQWGMSIDLTACTGCNACVVACQAENNIPSVGPEQVKAGREMHWLRIDRYFEGPEDDPEIYVQPVLCMHCENAPCELVCPVEATSHSPSGLNEMTYNRCVGTRYCSHNCPYKVRRFNFLQYSDRNTEVLKLLRNPDVTVRNRGVMEKCSYCVQRINYARIEAKKEQRPIRDGEIVTACEGACPSQAIVFGDITDPKARVARAKSEPLTYGLLAELNTRPRTTYLARLSNPNPDLSKPEEPHGRGH